MSQSSFEIFDSQTSETKSFWKLYQRINQSSEIVYSGVLLFPSLNKVLKPRKVDLSSNCLYRYTKDSKSIKSFSIICWKKLEPFSEVSKNHTRYGFRLGHSEIFQDFYTTNSKELDTWLAALAKLVILADVDEDFIILKEIGSGNYGRVYLVEDNSTHEQYALKTISKQVIQNSTQGIQSLKNEIEILRLLNHPRIIKLYRVYEDLEKISLIMTYAGQSDLFESLSKNKRFPERLVSSLIHNLLSVLLHIHSLSIIHRDLKPENILFTTFEPNITLCDFGLSCFISDESITRCGSPGFVAPEILLGQNYSDKVDTFAVGVITYMLLTGNSPFNGKNTKEILVKNKQCKLEFNDKIWNQFSRHALDFVRKLINPDPVSRLSAFEALNHRWIAGRKESCEATPETALNEFDPGEVWKVPTLVKIDKPEFRKRGDLGVGNLN